MFFRIAGALMFVAAGGFFGAARSAVYRKRLENCTEIQQILRKSEILIRYNCCDVFEIAEELRNSSEIFSRLPQDMSGVFNIDKELCKAVEKSVSSREEREILLRFCGEIGTTDTDGQLKMLGCLLETVSELRQARQAEYAKYGRLYRSLGILFGMMAGVAVI